MKVTITDRDKESKQIIRKVILEKSDSKITRKLFILGDSERRNNKVDVIDKYVISIEDINKMSANEIGNKLKKQLDDHFKRLVDDEISFFKSPKITKNK